MGVVETALQKEAGPSRTTLVSWLQPKALGKQLKDFKWEEVWDQFDLERIILTWKSQKISNSCNWSLTTINYHTCSSVSCNRTTVLPLITTTHSFFYIALAQVYHEDTKMGKSWKIYSSGSRRGQGRPSDYSKGLTPVGKRDGRKFGFESLRL